MKEQAIQSKILKWLKERGFYVIKTIQTNRNGTPDILACAPNGMFVGIEVKTAIGKPSKLQLQHIEEINANNGLAFIARSVEDVNTMLGQFVPVELNAPNADARL